VIQCSESYEFKYLNLKKTFNWIRWNFWRYKWFSI